MPAGYALKYKPMLHCKESLKPDIYMQQAIRPFKQYNIPKFCKILSDEHTYLNTNPYHVSKLRYYKYIRLDCLYCGRWRTI